MMLARPLVAIAGLVMAWQVVVWATTLPHYILPAPTRVAAALLSRGDLILGHGIVTLIEIVVELVLGTIIGTMSALLMNHFRPARRWLLPLLVVSQAIPVFALAPLLVLWFGYGMASKIAMAIIIIYFPLTAAFYDGLSRTESGWLDLAHTMNGTRFAVLRHIRIPAALPAFGSGLRIAAAVAPIGAIVSEWVGSSADLGYLMLHANARLQIDLLFAALFVICLIALALYFTIDRVVRRTTAWQPDTSLTDRKD